MTDDVLACHTAGELEAALHDVRNGLRMGATAWDRTAAIEKLHRVAVTARAGLADRERLEAVLDKYGQHSIGCDTVVHSGYGEQTCNCGFDASRGVHPAGTETAISGASSAADPSRNPDDATVGERFAEIARVFVEDGRISNDDVDFLIEQSEWLAAMNKALADKNDELLRERSERPQDVPLRDAFNDPCHVVATYDGHCALGTLGCVHIHPLPVDAVVPSGVHTPAPTPLSPESEALLKQGLEDAKAGRIVDLGSFAQYADDDADGSPTPAQLVDENG